MSSEQFQRGDRVEQQYCGFGTVLFLDGDPVPDEPGERYNWPGHVCVQFDTLINGEIEQCWCEKAELRKV